MAGSGTYLLFPGHEKGPAAWAGERAPPPRRSSNWLLSHRMAASAATVARLLACAVAALLLAGGATAWCASPALPCPPPPALGAARFGPSRRRAPPGLPVTCAVDVELRVTVSPAEDGKFNVNVKGTTHIGACAAIRSVAPPPPRRPSARGSPLRCSRRPVGVRGESAARPVRVGRRFHRAQRVR